MKEKISDVKNQSQMTRNIELNCLPCISVCKVGYGLREDKGNKSKTEGLPDLPQRFAPHPQEASNKEQNMSFHVIGQLLPSWSLCTHQGSDKKRKEKKHKRLK